MKVYLKKVAIVLLTLAIILSSVPTSAFIVFGHELGEVEQVSSTEEVMETFEEVKSSDVKNESIFKEESKSSNTDQSKPMDEKISETLSVDKKSESTDKENTQPLDEKTIEDKEKTETSDKEETKAPNEGSIEDKEKAKASDEETIVDKEETKASNKKTSKLKAKNDSTLKSDNSNIEESDKDEEMPLEQDMGIQVYALSNEETENNTVSDFTYYFESNKNDKKSCTHSELNSIIANAVEKMYIEMNNNVTLDNTLTFDKASNYEFNLKGHSLTIVSGKRMIVAKSNANVTIENGTLTGANANVGSVEEKRGSAIYCNNANINVNDMTISNNISKHFGGAIYVNKGNITIKESNITKNNGLSGGAIYLDINSSGTIINSTISKNTNDKLDENGKFFYYNDEYDPVAYGGAAIYVNSTINSTAKTSLTIKGSNITNNGIDDGGSIITTFSDYFNEGPGVQVDITDGTVISGNKGKSNSILNIINGKLTIKDSKITNNQHTGIVLVIENSAKGNKKAIIENTEISNNEKGIDVDMGAELEGNNLKYTNNNEGMYVRGTLNLKNSVISGNHGTKESRSKWEKTGAIYGNSDCKITLTDTIVRNNIGTDVGGIFIDGGTTSERSLTVNGGAIYNNKANTTIEDNLYANDIYILQYSTTTANIPAVELMESDEEGKIFEGYYWQHYSSANNYSEEKIKDGIELVQDANVNKIYHIYNVSNLPERDIAELIKVDGTTEKFQSIAEAINLASDGETVKLIAGEDGRGTGINESVTISEDKSIIIDLNGKNWSSGNENYKALNIEGNANVKINGSGSLANIDYINGSLELNSSAKIKEIYLGTGKAVKLGTDFPTEEISENITLVISDEDRNKLETEDIKLIETTNTISENIVNKILVKDLNSYIKIITGENDNIFAHKVKGVFINGKSGDDTNDGLTKDTPVKTFEKAKEILINNNYDCIWVTDTITINGNETWSIPQETSLRRYPEFKGYLVNINGELTLKDITIDGDAKNIVSEEALIKVNASAILNIEDGTKLINNNNTSTKGNYREAGGAIYCYNGYVKMSGGEISGNTSWYGAGIELYGSNAKMDLKDGSINNNTAKNVRK